MSGRLQSLIQHQKQLLSKFLENNFYLFQPFTPKWNLRRLASLNFLDISESSQGLEARQKHIIFCYTPKTCNKNTIHGSFQFSDGYLLVALVMI